MAIQKLFSVLFLHLVLAFLLVELTNARGLQLGFYRRTCPDAELIVHKTLHRYISRDPTLAAPLLRMYFHDCFIRGCDGSVLLSSTKKNQAEKDAIPNKTLRGFNVIDAVKSALEKKCPGVVSCSDVLALVARDAVLMIGGPHWDVPTGRRDGRLSIANEALFNLPSPFANISVLKQQFAATGLSVKDLAVLSGGHTIGIGHCTIISNRLYNFTGKGDTDPSLDRRYAAQLKKKCKPGNSNTVVEMDPGSFKTFDEDYYTIVAKRRGLFRSDAALLDDAETRDYVKFQSRTQGSTFAQDFAESMVKMGYIGVLTGKQGEIRKRCAVVN
ncbi:PREDICTED: peroxidase 27-like [Populus euphratica]|uniref:Peroxidase n=1 Tax=Populus euphratica TaxID=75702 RepID=A0AAJ6T2T2_POPEU|nr:PREDICTED: peroxidase 27-like [Populus euphratica]